MPASAPQASATLPNSRPSTARQLSPTDQLAYDVFAYQTKDTLRGLQPDLLEPQLSSRR